MIPISRFDFWIDWKQWGLGGAVDFRGRLWAMLGPINIGVNFYV